MNNNRNNNRRRGRGNRNQGGGGNQANRIDSRARGNAPQLLEKYKKLAQDAQHNGDRVQAEYFLQFADHYFRVLADNKTRQDEGQRRRADERDNDDENDGEDNDTRRRSAGSDNRRQRHRRDDREDRYGDSRDSEIRDDDAAGEPAYEPAENPFVVKDEGEARPDRNARKPRRTANGESRDGEFDAAALPPSIGSRDANDDDKPKPRPSSAKRRRKAGEDGAVSAVG